MTTTSAVSTPLDDLKDLAYIAVERVDNTYEELSARDIFLDDDGEGWALDNLRRVARETIAKHIPGMSIAKNGLPVYATEEAYTAAHTYDDGTPLVERIQFPDAPGVLFVYRPRHDRPRDEFMSWAREYADKRKADIHARYLSVEGLSIEYIDSTDTEFSAHLHVGDTDTHVDLTREQLVELRDGIVRILGTQAKAGNAPDAEAGEEWAPAKVHHMDGFVHVGSQWGPKPGVYVESFDGNAQGEVAMSTDEARALASLLLERADAADHLQAKGEPWLKPESA